MIANRGGGEDKLDKTEKMDSSCSWCFKHADKFYSKQVQCRRKNKLSDC